MLQKFTVNNFKSLVNVTYEPGVANLLLGVNSSGKTNLCQALRFLSRLAQRREATIFHVWHGVTEQTPPDQARNIYFDQPTIDLGCTCELTVNDEQLTFVYSLVIRPDGPFSIETETLYVSGGAFGVETVTLLENKAGEIRLLDEDSYLQGLDLDACYQDTTMHNSATMLSLLYDKRANRRAMAFRRYLTAWQYYDLAPGCLRDDRFDSHADVLRPDGSNLTSVLFRFKSIDKQRYQRLVELVQSVDQRVAALDFATVGNYIQMELVDAQGHRFNMSSISDGTLRFMALCYIVLDNARMRHPPLTIIEEAEGSLYARNLEPLFELFDLSGAGGQYIFTSHSSYFIELFGTHLDNVIVMQDQGTHSALITPDPVQMRAYVGDTPLSEWRFKRA